MTRRNDSIIAELRGYQIMSKSADEVFFQNPQGACMSLTDAFMLSFLNDYDNNPEFQRNFTTKEINRIGDIDILKSQDRRWVCLH